MPETELTQDEYTVLLIASSGEYMMPIGRWEKPVEALVQRGLLHRHDKFNNTITEKGKEAVKLREAQDGHAMLTAMNNLAIASRSEGVDPEITKLETAAKALFDHARTFPDFENYRVGALVKASEEVMKRALEFL